MANQENEELNRKICLRPFDTLSKLDRAWTHNTKPTFFSNKWRPPFKSTDDWHIKYHETR